MLFSQRPWEKEYRGAQPWDEALENTTLVSLFDHAAHAFSDRPAIEFLGAYLTYARLADNIHRLANQLEEAGVRQGVRVGICMPNCPFFPMAYFAILKLGAIVVPLNPLYPQGELEGYIQNADVSVVCGVDLSLVAAPLCSLLEKGVFQTLVLAPFTDFLPFFKRIAFKLFRSQELFQAVSPPSGRLLWYVPVLKNGTSKITPLHTALIVEPDHNAVLQYTGGTTGRAKAATLTHHNLSVNVLQIRAFTGIFEPGEERFFGILPLFHVFSMTVVMNLCLSLGGMVSLVPQFHPRTVQSTFRRVRPTLLPAVPRLITALLDQTNLSKADYNSLRAIISGGAALPEAVRQRFSKVSSCPLLEGYGLSETSPVVTCTPPGGPEKHGSVGVPLPGTVVGIAEISDEFLEVPVGEKGEICVCGPQVMMGYWKEPLETQKAFVQACFKTGDIGYLDEDGYLFIVDRLKDLINVSGFKVYPRVVEEVLLSHPDIADVAVIGVPDDTTGEAPKAFVVLNPQSILSKEEILGFLEEKLSKREHPKHIEFCEEIPKTFLGKSSKKNLKTKTTQ